MAVAVNDCLAYSLRLGSMLKDKYPTESLNSLASEGSPSYEVVQVAPIGRMAKEQHAAQMR